MTEPVEPDAMIADMDDVGERAERGRMFYEMFPGTGVSDRWVEEFEHLQTPPRAWHHAEELKIED